MEHIYFKFYQKMVLIEYIFTIFLGDSGSSQGLKKGNANKKNELLTPCLIIIGFFCVLYMGFF